MPYTVTEPHPSVPRGRSTYLQAGRGGAGNYAKYDIEDLTVGPCAVGPASRAQLSPPPTTSRFTSGRGGAGNTFKRSSSQRAMFSFDEELARDQKMMENKAKAPVYHIGRGGAGNAVDEMKPGSGMRQGSSGSITSADSTGSDKAKRSMGDMFRTLSRTVSRN